MAGSLGEHPHRGRGEGDGMGVCRGEMGKGNSF